MVTKIPKDLGIKIGTPDEVFWTRVLNSAKILLGKLKQDEKDLPNTILLQKEVIKLAKNKILLEQRK